MNAKLSTIAVVNSTIGGSRSMTAMLARIRIVNPIQYVSDSSPATKKNGRSSGRRPCPVEERRHHAKPMSSPGPTAHNGGVYLTYW
jgi:hypothetical protein